MRMLQPKLKSKGREKESAKRKLTFVVRKIFLTLRLCNLDIFETFNFNRQFSTLFLPVVHFSVLLFFFTVGVFEI